MEGYQGPTLARSLGFAPSRVRIPVPTQKSPGAMAGAHQDKGWGRGIRVRLAPPGPLRALSRPCVLRRPTLARSLGFAPSRVRIPVPTQKSPGAMAGAQQNKGWGRGIRTPVTGTKNRGPAAGRYPNADVLLSQPI